MAKILLADDESCIHDIVGEICKDDGNELLSAYNGVEALHLCVQQRPDFIILDVMMPKLDGFQLCRSLREQKIDVPILFLSAKGDIVDKGVGFDAGGDDYMVKPFSPQELSFRIKAHLQRQRRLTGAATVIEYEGLVVDASKRRVSKGGKNIDLTPKEFDILALLATNRGEVFTRDRLTTEVWGDEYTGEVLGVAVYIRRIREKIEDNPSKPRFVQTVWREGYRFGD